MNIINFKVTDNQYDRLS